MMISVLITTKKKLVFFCWYKAYYIIEGHSNEMVQNTGVDTYFILVNLKFIPK